MIDKSIEAKALTILREYGIEKFPIDVKKIANELGIEVLEEEFEDNIAGLLYSKKGSYIIGLNANHHENRKRFTIAHEIGHYVLHFPKDNDLIVDTKRYLFPRATNMSSGVDKERQANMFAAALLMPSDLLEKFIADENLSLDDDLDIWKISSKIKVSEQALTYRLLNLELIEY